MKVTVSLTFELQLYGEGGWFLIEEFSYSVLLNKCLEKQGEQDNHVAEQEEQEEMAEEQNLEMAQEEETEEVEVIYSFYICLLKVLH